MSKNLLKTLLPTIAFVDGIGKGRDYVSIGSGLCPERVVVEMALVTLFSGVVNVLYIDKNGYFFHAPI